MYWEENRTHRNKVVSLRNKSIATYFSKNCSKHDKSFCSAVSPFISDKNKRADSKFILQEGEEIIVDNLKVSNVFNDYFSDIALNIGFDDFITSSCDAIAKYINHPSVLKIKDMYKIRDDSFHFTSVDVCTIDKKLCNIANKKITRIW